MKTHVQWLDRSLVESPYHFGLCRSEKAFHKELKRLKVPREQWPNFMGSDVANATVHFFEESGGKLCAIVCIGSTEGRTLVQVYGLLVHEAVHIWQEVRDTLGERTPSAEFEAYSVQSIAQSLMEAYGEA